MSTTLAPSDAPRAQAKKDEEEKTDEEEPTDEVFVAGEPLEHEDSTKPEADADATEEGVGAPEETQESEVPLHVPSPIPLHVPTKYGRLRSHIPLLTPGSCLGATFLGFLCTSELF